MIKLLPDYVYFSDFPSGTSWEPLDEAPNYVSSREATRWHRARSGKIFDGTRNCYSYWCGPSGDFGVEVIGLGDEMCGTCEGRFIAQRDNPWLFTPRKSLPPGMCPASGREDLVPVPYQRYFHCPVCGEIVGSRSVSGYYGGAAVTRHRTGPDLITPCRWHGWYSLRMHSGSVVCGCAVRTVPA